MARLPTDPDGGDDRYFVKRLHERLSRGLGHSVRSASGAILMRSLVDIAASGSGERWFEASAF